MLSDRITFDEARAEMAKVHAAAQALEAKTTFPTPPAQDVRIAAYEAARSRAVIEALNIARECRELRSWVIQTIFYMNREKRAAKSRRATPTAPIPAAYRAAYHSGWIALDALVEE